MRFNRSPWTKNEIRPRSPQRIAAARRAVQRDKDAVPLFPEMVKHHTADERLRAMEVGAVEWHCEMRASRAATWREARRRLYALPPLTHAGVLRYWSSDSWIPRDPSYLADLIHGVTHRHECCWRMLRIRRQMKLVREGRLPRTVLQAIIRSNDNRLFKPYASVRIQNRLYELRHHIKPT